MRSGTSVHQVDALLHPSHLSDSKPPLSLTGLHLLWLSARSRVFGGLSYGVNERNRFRGRQCQEPPGWRHDDSCHVLWCVSAQRPQTNITAWYEHSVLIESMWGTSFVTVVSERQRVLSQLYFKVTSWDVKKHDRPPVSYLGIVCADVLNTLSSQVT